MEIKETRGKIRGYHDLKVYQIAYSAMLEVYKEVILKLPKDEIDLTGQLRRSCKAVPRLIAEGHSKRHQIKGFQKYIDDAMAESNETAVSLCQARDICGKYLNLEKCEKLITTYDMISRMLYYLAVAWQKFGNRKKWSEVDSY